MFCEKPVATELSDTKACYDLAEKNGQFLFCAFNRYSIYRLIRAVFVHNIDSKIS